MKIKTSELTGPALDWAVAKCERHYERYLLGHSYIVEWRNRRTARYSTDWAHGGPIIEREKISHYYMPGEVGGAWRAELLGRFMQDGPTLLIAATRCYVACKLGDEVDVPEELL